MAETSERSSKRSRLEYKDIFTVLVGPDEESFSIHASIATSKSKFFEAACRGTWTEAQAKVVRLPEVSPDIFKAYVQWMYSGEVVNPSEPEIDAGCEGHAPQVALVKLYHLGDVLLDLPLRNRVMDVYISLRRKFTGGSGSQAIYWAWEHLPPTSTMRRFVLAEHLFQGAERSTWYGDNRGTLHASFLGDLVFAYSEAQWIRPTTHPMKASGCEYHEHDAEFPEC
ncbi:hypothetical protein LTR53_009877 [Teratosphaeriaceae sp. CCFEE 6253]|nr:hypothetical protein LTR53_009877 [Teratosphaeriaceae sp. CCFEE 6253]